MIRPESDRPEDTKMSQDQVVTRFPPSPTGELHLGGARTALFNWLFARGRGGKFILRIEDTDRQRSTQEATEGILKALEWLGLDWDEGPYFQSQRTEIYRARAEKLVEAGRAYWCHCSPETLEVKRNQALAEKRKPLYDRTCRDKGLGPAQGAVVRVAIPPDGATVYQDYIMGPIRTDHRELDDLIILRSDSTPTYHFAVVVDDVEMGVNWIIRGQDHVNNTPRQIQIYQALGAELPNFAHVPMIHGQDGAKLSKRHGATSVMVYQEQGYLPQAMVNYLVRLGWSHGDEEIFSRQELIDLFDLESVGRSAGIFDLEKLQWLNSHYLREAEDTSLAELMLPFYSELGVKPEKKRIIPCLELFKPRAKTLVEVAEQSLFLFTPPTGYDPKGAKKVFKPQAADLLQELTEKLAEAEFSEEALDALFRSLAQEKEIKLGALAQPARLALTGRTASPGLFEIMALLGREETLSRLAKAREYILARNQETN